MRLVNSDEGDKELAILANSSDWDILEEHVMKIFNQAEPKLRKFRPVVIDEQEEALGAGVVHFMEREAKVL